MMIGYGKIPSIAILVLACLGCCAWPEALYAAQYRIDVLDILPIPPGAETFGRDSYAFGINNNGVVVGESSLNRIGSLGQTRPVRWPGTSQPDELWTDQFFGGMGIGINDAGVIVGRYGTGNTTPLPTGGVKEGRGFIWEPATRNYFDLGHLGGFKTEPRGINQSGQVVGSSDDANFQARAFIWDPVNGMQNLGTLGGQSSLGYDINDLGQVVGFSGIAEGSQRAFLWDPQTGMQNLGTLEAGIFVGSTAYAINNHTQVVGVSSGSFGGSFIWDPQNGMTSLLSPQEKVNALVGNDFTPFDINDLGQVVGIGVVVQDNGTSREQAILWESGAGPRLLRDLSINGSDWQSTTAFSINDAGQIVGYGVINDQIRAFIATPIPEPSLFLSAGLVCAGLTWRLNQWRAMRAKQRGCCAAIRTDNSFSNL